MMKKYILSVFLMSILALSVSAQKYGYVNSALLIEEIGAKEGLDKKLEEFQKGIQSDGEMKLAVFKKNETALSNEIMEGKLSRLAIENRQKALQQEYEALANFEREATAKVGAKRQEILAPVLTRIQEAIDAVAKEKGYRMIFDVSAMNAILFAEESENILAPVKLKLGL